jgi:hypothetical protein
MLRTVSVKQNVFDNLIANHVVKADMLNFYASMFS